MKNLLLSLLRTPLRWCGLYLYEYPKSDSAATTVVLFNNGTRTLIVVRRKNPHQGRRAFPGGFLNVGQETTRKNARRELQEETSLDFPEDRFQFVDVRSDPERDPRGHVIDHGFLVVVPEEETEAVLAAIHAKDDAKEAIVVDVADLLREGIAFDHLDLLRAALVKAGYTREV